jgi:hypothetical protein
MRFGILGKRRSRKSGDSKKIPATPILQPAAIDRTSAVPEIMVDLSPYARASRCSTRASTRTSTRDTSRASTRDSTRASRCESTASPSFSTVDNVALRVDLSAAPPPVSPRARWTFISRAFLKLSKRAAAASGRHSSPADSITSPTTTDKGATTSEFRLEAGVVKDGGSYVEFPIRECIYSGALLPPPRWQPEPETDVGCLSATPTSRPCSQYSTVPPSEATWTTLCGLPSSRRTSNVPTEQQRRVVDVPDVPDVPPPRLPRASTELIHRGRLTSSSSLYSVTSSGSIYLSTSTPERCHRSDVETDTSMWGGTAAGGPSIRRSGVASSHHCDEGSDCESDPDSPTFECGELDQQWCTETNGTDEWLQRRPSGEILSSGGAVSTQRVRRESYVRLNTVCSITEARKVNTKVFDVSVAKCSQSDVVRMLRRYAPAAGAFTFRESRGKVVLSIWDGFGVQHFGVNDGAHSLTASEFGGPQFRKFFRSFRASDSLPTRLTCAILG